MEKITNCYSVEPFLHEIFSFLNIKELFFLVRSLNHEIHSSSFFLYLYSNLKKRNRLKINTKTDYLHQFNSKFSKLLFIEPLQFTEENKNYFIQGLRDMLKFHHKLIIPDCIDIIKSNDIHYQNFVTNEDNFNHIKYILSNTRNFELLDSLQLEPIFVSSTDEPSQNIWQPILYDDMFWSSKGSISSEGNEYMIFKFTGIISFVAGFSIKSFKATFHDDNPVYGPKSIKISIGFSSESFHYSTEIIPLQNSNEPFSFFFLPYYIIGTYIRIDLIGKHQVQEIDYQYYHAIQKIIVYGKDIKNLNSEGLNKLMYNYLNTNNLLNYEYLCCLFDSTTAIKSEFYENLNNELTSLINTSIDENVKKNEVLWITAFKNLSQFIDNNSLFMLYHPKLIEIVNLLSKYKAFLGIHQRVLQKNESLFYKRYSDFDFLLFNYASGSKFGLEGRSNYIQLHDSLYTESKMKILNSSKAPLINSKLKYILYDGLVESFYSDEDINIMIKLLENNQFKLMPTVTKNIYKNNLSLMLEMVFKKFKQSPILYLEQFIKPLYSTEKNVYSCLLFYIAIIKILLKNGINTNDFIDHVSKMVYEYYE